MADQATLERDIRQFLTDNFPLADESYQLGSEDSLLEAGVIDSTGVLELIQFLEAQYEIEIPDDDVLPENLDSIRNIEQYVTRRLGGRANGSEGGSV
jgi:acyl carrier protein